MPDTTIDPGRCRITTDDGERRCERPTGHPGMHTALIPDDPRWPADGFSVEQWRTEAEVSAIHELAELQHHAAAWHPASPERPRCDADDGPAGFMGLCHQAPGHGGQHQDRGGWEWPTGRPAADETAPCPNCDGRRCMACCSRELHDECADDCPTCCAAESAGKEPKRGADQGEPMGESAENSIQADLASDERPPTPLVVALGLIAKAAGLETRESFLNVDLVAGFVRQLREEQREARAECAEADRKRATADRDLAEMVVERDDARREKNAARAVITEVAMAAHWPVSEPHGLGEHICKQRSAVERTRADLRYLGHSADGQLDRDVDRAIDRERERTHEALAAVARALGMTEPDHALTPLDVAEFAAQLRHSLDGHVRDREARQTAERAGWTATTAGLAKLADEVRATGGWPEPYRAPERPEQRRRQAALDRACAEQGHIEVVLESGEYPRCDYCGRSPLSTAELRRAGIGSDPEAVPDVGAPRQDFADAPTPADDEARCPDPARIGCARPHGHDGGCSTVRYASDRKVAEA